MAGSKLLAAAPVNERYSEEERLRLLLVLVRHLRQPVDDDGAHTLVDRRLLRHVAVSGRVLGLQLRKRSNSEHGNNDVIMHADGLGTLASLDLRWCWLTSIRA